MKWFSVFLLTGPHSIIRARVSCLLSEIRPSPDYPTCDSKLFQNPKGRSRRKTTLDVLPRISASRQTSGLADERVSDRAKSHPLHGGEGLNVKGCSETQGGNRLRVLPSNLCFKTIWATMRRCTANLLPCTGRSFSGHKLERLTRTTFQSTVPLDRSLHCLKKLDR
jgi:hypothetical protein